MAIQNPGKYRARCAEDGLAPRFGRAESGNEQLALTFDLLDEEGNKTGETIDWVGTFASEKANEITLKALQACGWSGTDILNLSGINANEVELDVQSEDYNGEIRLKVKWINKPGGGRIKFKTELDSAGKRELAARLRGSIAQLKAGGGAPPSRQQAPAPRQNTAPLRAPATQGRGGYGNSSGPPDEDFGYGHDDGPGF